MSEISKRLMKFRRDSGLSQEEVAEKLNVSRQTVSKWETGQSTPDFDKIAPLCELYGVTTDELLRGVVSDKKQKDEKVEEEDDRSDEGDNDNDDDKKCCKKCCEEKSTSSVVVHCIYTVLALITLLLYLGISFATGMWYITWIIWLIYAVIVTVIKLILAIFGIYVDDDYKGHKIDKPKSRGLRIIGLIFGLFFLLVIIGAIGAFFILPGGVFFGIHKGVSGNQVHYESYDVDFETLKITAKAGVVDVKDTLEDKMTVIIYSDEAKEYEVKKYDDIFKIDVENEGCHGIACFKYNIPKIEVYVPEKYADKIVIKNNYGDINVGYFERATLDIDEDMGKVSVKAAKDLKIRNSMGETDINKVYSRADIDVSMGSLNIDELNLDQNSNIEASMGSINISKTNNVYIDASADMGSVNIAKNNRESKVELKIRCSMGSINVGD